MKKWITKLVTILFDDVSISYNVLCVAVYVNILFVVEHIFMKTHFVHAEKLTNNFLHT